LPLPKNYLSSLQPAKLFLIAGSVLGLVCMVLNPPFQAPDEPNHFFRAYQISEGNFIAEIENQRVGGHIPASLPEFARPFMLLVAGHDLPADSLIAASSATDLAPHNRTFVDFNNTVFYSPVCYLPQAIALLVLKPLDPPVLVLLYGARLLTLVIWLIAVYQAIRLMPFGKWLTASLALLPMSLFINSAVSADGMTTSVVFLLISYVLHLRYQNAAASWRQLAILLLLLTCLALVKNAYVAMVLLVLLVRRSSLGTPPRALLVYMVLIAAPLLTTMTWAGAVDHLYLSYDGYNVSYRDEVALVKGADARKQAQLIIEHRVIAWRVIGRSFARWITEHIPGYVATFGWNNITPAWWLIALIYLMLWCIAVAEPGPSVRSDSLQRAVLLITFFTALSAVFLSLFLAWSVYGNQGGVYLQGRYVIPIYPLAFLAANNVRKHESYLVTKILVITVVLISAGCLVTLFDHYFL
jgi:uncharacterized membrane protein